MTKYGYRQLLLERAFYLTLLLMLIFSSLIIQTVHSAEKQSIKALYIPLADHYAALVVYERYPKQMQHADFQIEQMKNWDLLRAHVMSPLATDSAIERKYNAVKEVMHFIHKAGADIEAAREQGGEALESIVNIVRKHIPLHNREAIIASLNPKLRVINYQHLNVDKAGLKQIMDFAVEGGIIQAPIDIDRFSDERFGINK